MVPLCYVGIIDFMSVIPLPETNQGGKKKKDHVQFLTGFIKSTNIIKIGFVSRKKISECTERTIFLPLQAVF